jgi:hypothetical protein
MLSFGTRLPADLVPFLYPFLSSLDRDLIPIYKYKDSRVQGHLVDYLAKKEIPEVQIQVFGPTSRVSSTFSLTKMGMTAAVPSGTSMFLLCPML